MASYSTRMRWAKNHWEVDLLRDGVEVASMPLDEWMELEAVKYVAEEAVTRAEDHRAAALDPAAGAEAGEMPRRPRH